MLNSGSARRSPGSHIPSRLKLERTLRLGIVSLLLALSVAWAGSTPISNAANAGAVHTYVNLDTASDLDPTLLGDALPNSAGTWLGRLDASQELEFEVGLALPDAAATEKFVASLSDPTSANYHHYLTPDEYTAHFNASADQQNFVIDYLTRRGFVVTQTSPNRLLLQVRAPVRTIETTFHTQLSSYHYDGDDQSFEYFAPTHQTLLPTSLRGLVSGVILSNFPLQRKNKHIAIQNRNQTSTRLLNVLLDTRSTTDTINVLSAAATESCEFSRTETVPCLTPTGLRQLYNINPLINAGADGSGQTIALFEQGSFDPINIGNYVAHYNLPQPNYSVVKVGSGTDKTYEAGEIDLDMEVVMAIAPKASMVIYEAGFQKFAITFAQAFSRIVSDNNNASVVTISYGACEGSGYPGAFSPEGATLIHTILMQGYGTGKTFFVSSGDSGVYGCTSGEHKNSQGQFLADRVGVDYPAADPFVISVGGTQIRGINLSTPDEQVWNEAPNGGHGYYLDGSGGGVSKIFKQPDWQKGLGLNTGFRQVPDVAALAGFPYYSTFSNGENIPTLNGGTSAAAPLWAAATLLINQLAKKNLLSVDKLYTIASKPNYAFRDIKVGNNGDSQFSYSAGPGYDLATGLGTPDFTQLYNALSGQTTLPNPTARPPTTLPPVTGTPNPTATPAPQPTPTPTPTPAPPPVTTPTVQPASLVFSWKKYAVTPVFGPGAANSWDSGSVYPQTIIWDAAARLYKMWYSGTSEGGLPGLGYATSPDGVSWTRAATNPVVAAGPVSNWDSQGILQAAVIYDPDDKLYKLWYSSKTTYTAPSIGYAISNDGIAWTKDASPVLLAGPTAFDFGGMQPSTVIKENGQYKLWYEAVDDHSHRALAFAYSLDGVHWGKAQSANVQIEGAIYNSDGPGAPSVVHYENAYYLWYHTSTNLMQASSLDGLNFKLDPSIGPVLDVGVAGSSDSNRLIMPRVTLRPDSGQALMWYSGYNGTNWAGMFATSPLASGNRPVNNHTFADTAFQQVWVRPDQPVSNAAAQRGWIWGPGPQASAHEEYVEAAGGLRLVQYFDKGRLEINNQATTRTDPYFVSSGLLAKEMLEGKIQTGNNSFRNVGASTVPVAGDTDDTNGPTYASFAHVTGMAAVQVGQPIIGAIDNQGHTSDNQPLAGYGVTAAFYVPETKHSIASPFWDFLNSSGLLYDNNGNRITDKLFSPTFYVTGLPLAEAYWANVKVAGQTKAVLIQVFERRVLTYTPANQPSQQTEMGNVGRAYFQWRYGQPLS